ASAHVSIGSPGSGDGLPGAPASKCKTPVKLGVTYSSDLGPGLAAVGSPGTAADAANYAREQQALWQRGADDINSRGGFGGCKVVVGSHDFHVLDTSCFSTGSQAGCPAVA